MELPSLVRGYYYYYYYYSKWLDMCPHHRPYSFSLCIHILTFFGIRSYISWDRCSRWHTNELSHNRERHFWKIIIFLPKIVTTGKVNPFRFSLVYQSHGILKNHEDLSDRRLQTSGRFPRPNARLQPGSDPGVERYGRDHQTTDEARSTNRRDMDERSLESAAKSSVRLL